MEAVLRKAKTVSNSCSGEIRLRSHYVTIWDNPHDFISSSSWQSAEKRDRQWADWGFEGVVGRLGKYLCTTNQLLMGTLTSGRANDCFPFVLPVATNKRFHSARWKDAVAEPMSFHTQAAIVRKSKLVSLSGFWLFCAWPRVHSHVSGASSRCWWAPVFVLTFVLSFQVRLENRSGRTNTRKPRAVCDPSWGNYSTFPPSFLHSSWPWPLTSQWKRTVWQITDSVNTSQAQRFQHFIFNIQVLSAIIPHIFLYHQRCPNLPSIELSPYTLFNHPPPFTPSLTICALSSFLECIALKQLS